MFIIEHDFSQEQLYALYKDLDNSFVSERKTYNQRIKKSQRKTIPFIFKRELRVNKNLFKKVYCFFKNKTPFFVSKEVGTLDYDIISISR